MLILMKSNAGADQLEAVAARVRELGLTPHPLQSSSRTVVGVTGEYNGLDPAVFSALAGVSKVMRLSAPFKLAAREFHVDDTVVDVSGVKIGAGQKLCIMAGPCSFESEAQVMAIAHAVKDAGAGIMRGGLFKPRTSPFTFQGLRDDGFKLMQAVRSETGLRFVTEAVDERSLALVEEHADMIQIGARNMQNFALLKKAGQAKKPVLLKRGMSATLDEWLTAADYILSEGNSQVVLCERGIRTFANHTRNTLDLSVVPAVKELSHLPVIVDPSHGTGMRNYVPPMALAAVAAGADGIMVEVHNDPEQAKSDGAQSLFIEQFTEMARRIPEVARAVGRDF
ncbi:MAG: 3-deoxy-7-phosphoheptulonate synthase [Planctomycetes bacterium]|nr:3-deoxy-7-phosphoheptulonate synthase [Planctomycetota bacterium]